jgi:hypothetical protein
MRHHRVEPQHSRVDAQRDGDQPEHVENDALEPLGQLAADQPAERATGCHRRGIDQGPIENRPHGD